MPSKLRTFVGLPIPPLAGLVEIVRELRSLGRPLRVAKPDELHLTLKFLGETPLDEVAPLAHALKHALAEFPAGECRVRGLGAFPTPARPGVVWAGLAGDGTELLRSLAKCIEQVCEPFGYAPETRDFHPHVTLARVAGRPPTGLASLLEDCRETDFGSVPIETVILYRSDAAGPGPRYQPLARFALGGV